MVAGALGVWLGFPAADPIAGLVISVAILVVLRTAVKAVLLRLMNGVDPDLVDQIEHQANHVDGVRSVADVRVRWEGHRLRSDLAIDVDPMSTVAVAHDTAHEVERRLTSRIPHLDAVVVHVGPAATIDAGTER